MVTKQEINQALNNVECSICGYKDGLLSKGEGDMVPVGEPMYYWVWMFTKEGGHIREVVYRGRRQFVCYAHGSKAATVRTYEMAKSYLSEYDAGQDPQMTPEEYDLLVGGGLITYLPVSIVEVEYGGSGPRATDFMLAIAEYEKNKPPAQTFAPEHVESENRVGGPVPVSDLEMVDEAVGDSGDSMFSYEIRHGDAFITCTHCGAELSNDGSHYAGCIVGED